MIIAAGNTYQAKDSLKLMGFSWNKIQRRWEAESINIEDWANKHLNPTWTGRKEARLNAAANIRFFDNGQEIS